MLSWLPNIFSFGNLICGFFSMILAAHTLNSFYFQEDQLFLMSGILILVAAVLDGLDGPLARALGVESSLGEQLDSLADMTTFGLAPAFLMYQLHLKKLTYQFSWWSDSQFMPIFGIIIAAFYPACAAFRLARFNVSHETSRFSGLPSPIAGVFVALLPIGFRKSISLPPEIAIAIYLGMGFLMVSNIQYPKPQMHIRENLNSFKILIFSLTIVILTATLGWYWLIVSIFILYIFSGILAFLFHTIQKITIRLCK